MSEKVRKLCFFRHNGLGAAQFKSLSYATHHNKSIVRVVSTNHTSSSRASSSRSEVNKCYINRLTRVSIVHTNTDTHNSLVHFQCKAFAFAYTLPKKIYYNERCNKTRAVLQSLSLLAGISSRWLLSEDNMDPLLCIPFMCVYYMYM